MLLETVEEWNKEILEKGRKEGLEKGHRQLLLRQLAVKFGTLNRQTRARVAAADSRRLMEWGERVLTAERLADVFEH